jgi:hypothetical protein
MNVADDDHVVETMMMNAVHDDVDVIVDNILYLIDTCSLG